MTHGDRGLRRPAPVLLALEGQSYDPGGGATLSLDGDEDGRYRCSAVAVRPPGSDVCDNDRVFEFVSWGRREGRVLARRERARIRQARIEYMSPRPTT